MHRKMKNRKGKDLFMKKENPADYRVWQAYVKIKCQCICIKLCILYVFVDHSDYYFIVFPAALDDAAEIRPVKGGVRRSCHRRLCR